MVGARSVREVLVSFSVPDAGSAILNVPFNQKSTVAVFGFDLGFTFDLGTHFFVGRRHGAALPDGPGQFDGLEGLPVIDDSTGQWTAPVVASIGVRF